MKKKIFIIAGIVILAGLILIGNLKRGRSSDKKITVQTAKVKKGEIIQRISAPGKIKSKTEVKISAALLGKITKLPVKEGDFVEEGKVIVEIDPLRYRAGLTQAKANLELARAKAEESEILLSRKKELAEKNLISKEEIEAIETQHKMNLAQVKQSEAILLQAKDDLSKTTISAPISGTVTQLNVEEGEVVVTGTMNNPGSVIMTIADLSSMEVEAEVDETDVKSIALGQSVEIAVDAIPDTSFNGKVLTIGNAALTKLGLGGIGESVYFRVKIVVTDKVPVLRPGMSSTVKITTASKKDVLYVPIQSVVMRQVEKEKKEAEEKRRRVSGRHSSNLDSLDERNKEKEKEVVYVVDKGEAKIRPVKTGIADEYNQEIIEGLKEGEEVIRGPFKALLSVKEGNKIKVDNSKLKGLQEKK